MPGSWAAVEKLLGCSGNAWAMVEKLLGCIGNAWAAVEMALWGKIGIRVLSWGMTSEAENIYFLLVGWDPQVLNFIQGFTFAATATPNTIPYLGKSNVLHWTNSTGPASNAAHSSIPWVPSSGASMRTIEQFHFSGFVGIMPNLKKALNFVLSWPNLIIDWHHLRIMEKAESIY